MANQTDNNSTAQIRALNDKFRQTFDAKLGKVIITHGCGCLNTNQLQQLIQAVKEFKDFNENNDPWKEHDLQFPQKNGAGFPFWVGDPERTSLCA